MRSHSPLGRSRGFLRSTERKSSPDHVTTCSFFRSHSASSQHPRRCARNPRAKNQSWREFHWLPYQSSNSVLGFVFSNHVFALGHHPKILNNCAPNWVRFFRSHFRPRPHRRWVRFAKIVFGPTAHDASTRPRPRDFVLSTHHPPCGTIRNAATPRLLLGLGPL
jgi:hypothetical protein